MALQTSLWLRDVNGIIFMYGKLAYIVVYVHVFTTLWRIANGTMRKTQPYTIHIGIDRYSIRLPHVLGGWGPNGLGHQDISGNSSTDVFAENEAQHGSKSVVRGGKEKNYLGIAEWGAVMRYWGKSELYYIVHRIHRWLFHEIGEMSCRAKKQSGRERR